LDIYICGFIIKILFPTGDQLERYCAVCASDIFYSSQAAYNCYEFYPDWPSFQWE